MIYLQSETLTQYSDQQPSDLLLHLISTTHATTHAIIEGDSSTTGLIHSTNVIGTVCLGPVCWKRDPYSQYLNLHKLCHVNETHVNYLGSSKLVNVRPCSFMKHAIAASGHTIYKVQMQLKLTVFLEP